MGFIIGFIIAWLLSDLVTHHKIADECEKLGGFYTGNRTYKCIEITTSKTDSSIPPAILEAEKGGRNG